MADNFLITGYWGEPHVTAENDRGINASIFGTGRFVLPVGEQFRAEYIGNNTIRMYDGKLMDNGAAAGIPAGEYIDLLIANAGQGMKRNDLIVFQYSKDGSTLVESGKFVVVQGTETSGTAKDPVLTQQDLLSNEATFDQYALWRVPVSGTAISKPVKIFSARAIATQEALNQVFEALQVNKELTENINQYGLIFRRILTTDDDLDNVKEAGIYVYSTASIPANAPFSNAAVVEVFGADSQSTQKIQRAYRYGAQGYSAFRPLYSGKWLEWTKNSVYCEYSLNWDTSTNELTDSNGMSVETLCSSLRSEITAGKDVRINISNGTYNYTAFVTDSTNFFIAIYAPRMQKLYSWRIDEDSIAFWKEQFLADEVILSEGSDGNWNYRKWSSGRMEAWGNFNATVTEISTSSKVSGIVIITAQVKFPSGMISGESNVEYCSLQARNYQILGNMSGISSNNLWGRFTTYSGVESSFPVDSTDFPVHAYLTGRWK